LISLAPIDSAARLFSSSRFEFVDSCCCVSARVQIFPACFSYRAQNFVLLAFDPAFCEPSAAVLIFSPLATTTQPFLLPSAPAKLSFVISTACHRYLVFGANA
jgi:hypothetical protein